jgi:hypothetical protein
LFQKLLICNGIPRETHKPLPRRGTILRLEVLVNLDKITSVHIINTGVEINGLYQYDIRINNQSRGTVFHNRENPWYYLVNKATTLLMKNDEKGLEGDLNADNSYAKEPNS